MERVRKLELIQRSLGIRHKLKVHESMKTAETHEDLAVMLLSKWELEDELRAIEELLAGSRDANVGEKKKLISQGILKLKKSPPDDEQDSSSRRPSSRKR